MTVWFVTRHAGAKEWAEENGFKVDRMVEHLAISAIEEGDQVLGSLPINLVADLNARGARYFHLTLPLPPELRGQGISAALMNKLGTRLEEFTVTKTGKHNG